MTDSFEFPFPFSLIQEYFWLFSIVFGLGMIPILSARVKPMIEEDPFLESGYNKLIIGYVSAVIIPWVVFGFGMVVGKRDSIFSILLGLRHWDPFSILFFGTMIMEAVLFFVWVWFLGGTEFLAMHHGIVNGPGQSPRMLKIRALMTVIASLVLPFFISQSMVG